MSVNMNVRVIRSAEARPSLPREERVHSLQVECRARGARKTAPSRPESPPRVRGSPSAAIPRRRKSSSCALIWQVVLSIAAIDPGSDASRGRRPQHNARLSHEAPPRTTARSAPAHGLAALDASPRYDRPWARAHGGRPDCAGRSSSRCLIHRSLCPRPSQRPARQSKRQDRRARRAPDGEAPRPAARRHRRARSAGSALSASAAPSRSPIDKVDLADLVAGETQGRSFMPNPLELLSRPDAPPASASGHCAAEHLQAPLGGTQVPLHRPAHR